MKTIELDNVVPEVADLFDQAIGEKLVVRLASGKEFLVVEMEDDFDDEIVRTRANPRLMALLDELGRKPATIPLDEVERRLGL